MLGTIGEPIRFALHPDEAAGFFERRGYDVRDLCDSIALGERYQVGSRRLFPDNSVVRVAVV